MNEYEELSNLIGRVNAVCEAGGDSYDAWETRYDLIFSDSLAKRIRELMPFDYYDPDTSYEEDVTAYVRALNEAWDERKDILEARYG